MRKHFEGIVLGAVAGLLVYLGITAAQGDPIGPSTVLRGLAIAVIATGAGVFYAGRRRSTD